MSDPDATKVDEVLDEQLVDANRAREAARKPYVAPTLSRLDPAVGRARMGVATRRDDARARGE